MAANLKDLIAYAKKFEGVPYVYGGETPKGFDCSGYVRYVFAHFGIKLPRTSQDQARAGVAVDEGHLSPGDLVLSDWGEGPNSHIAIYAGNSTLLEAPRTGETVHAIYFSKGYGAHVNGYRRVTSKKTGILDTIEGIAGDYASGWVEGATGAASGLLQFPAEIVSFFTTATSDMAEVAQFFGAFFRPSTYVRIGAGFMGVTFLVAGCVFLLLEARE